MKRLRMIVVVACFSALVPKFAVSAEVKKGGAQPRPIILTADEHVKPYQRIKSLFYVDPETPDCAHKNFGSHITQQKDDLLDRFVFVFHIHVKPDNDRCEKFDRQRVEIKSMGDQKSPDYVKGLDGDEVSYRWQFKLPEGFQPSNYFTHLHQLKPYDGDDDLPVITLTARKKKKTELQIIHTDSKHKVTILDSTNLEPFLGQWVEAYEKVKFGSKGSYSIKIRRLSDQKILFSYDKSNLDLWREGTKVIRPKWGIYRSLQDKDNLRDEDILFGGFCIAKAPDDCAENIFKK